MNLVIVESPTKAKTIGKFLGKGYEVESSFGHIRDLPKSKLGIDVKHDFAPTYTIPLKAKETVKNLKTKASKANTVILATDEDREGEAIAWHLTQALGLLPDANQRMDTNDANKKQKNNSRYSHGFVNSHRVERIAFHEITKEAIEEALKNPRDIDLNLVDAQQARRVLDRLVGYELSPFLWRKIRYGLSAGRVQSVALRLVVEREREIQNFKSNEYWTIEGEFAKDKKSIEFHVRLISFEGKTLGKMDIKNEADAERIIDSLMDGKYRVQSVTSKEISRTPAPPFTTSTLQQEAARKLGFSAKQTMVIAQRLYENGFITYMRTDSVNVAYSALAQTQRVINDYFGPEYALPSPRVYATKAKGAQEAHEAIRPTDLAKKSGAEAGLSDRGQQRLYDLIWKRMIASQMQAAQIEQTAIDIATEDKKHVFRANGQTIKFDGFIRVYTEGRDEPEEESEGTLPPLKEGEFVIAKEIQPLQHFTEPPPRYTDATLVKSLEADGVGRPSTYAPILSTIQDRGYVEKKEKKYHPTEIGVLVNDLLVEHFPEIVDIKFTSHIEEEFDEIAEGKIKWTDVLAEFYGPFKKNLEEKEASVLKQTEESTTPCPHCGKMMIIKFGRMGKFLACPEPGSKVTLPMPEEAAQIKELQEKTKDERCPICGKPMDVKRGRFGFFLSCSDYPRCKGIMKIWNKSGLKCLACRARIAVAERDGEPFDDAQGKQGQTTKSSAPRPGSGQPASLVGDIVEKKSRGRGRAFWACTRYPDCTFIMNKKPESEAELAEAFKQWKKNPLKEKKKTTKD